VEDLAKMPHLLIAGATGSGKSVAINSLIIGMMYKIAPSDLRFILIDPKRVELSSFNGCPHLFLPTVTEPQEAMRVLLWGIEEMERRYRLMADASVKNIADYNKKILTGKIAISPVEEIISAMQKNPKAIIHGMTFPHIVIVIDEIADLMMKMGTEMEDILVRLAQMARSAGIHLIIATQRPSADVVTGLIKANFPARIAFRVATKWDSRVVLDSSGAETLLGNGDMLFLNPFGGDLIRAHGAYVSEEEIEQITEDLKAAGGG
jgi:S-DNA-T family DNA segregation ATPase FtsK/SpoIIIE